MYLYTTSLANHRLVCVVEDYEHCSIEKPALQRRLPRAARAISPLHGGPEHLRISNLTRRVDQGEVDEVILAPTQPSRRSHGQLSGGCAQETPREVTRIATGVPAGSDIEYTDEVTMHKAMEGRRSCRVSQSVQLVGGGVTG